MKKRKSGFYWFVHHGIRLEWCYDYDERVDFVECFKPEKEISIRLKWFKKVKGKLPAEVIKAGRVCEKAEGACLVTGQGETWSVYCDAMDACQEIIKHNLKVIDKLYEKECKGCPWDGKSLV